MRKDVVILLDGAAEQINKNIVYENLKCMGFRVFIKPYLKMVYFVLYPS